MEKSTKLTANQRLQIAVKIKEFQGTTSPDEGNPYRLIRYAVIADSVLGRHLASNTLRRILHDLGIIPKGRKTEKKPRVVPTSSDTKRTNEMIERLNELNTKYNRILGHVEAMNSHLHSIDKRLAVLEANLADKTQKAKPEPYTPTRPFPRD